MRVFHFFLPGLVLVVLSLSGSGIAKTVPRNCNALSWPDVNPVWSMCWVSPDLSSGVDGSGLELYNVQYKGQEVLFKADIPVLNVLYQPGGCGGPYLSFRDWGNELSPFQADNVVSPGLAEPATAPKTTCNHPGRDKGSFEGVAIQKGTDSLILTTQMAAGWYRYIQTWTFYANGSFSPRLAFTAIYNPCIFHLHTHNIYWRLDFDIDNYTDDVVDVGPRLIADQCCWTPITTETSDKRSVPFSKTGLWRVRNKTTGRGYVIMDNSSDGVADTFGDADRWVLKYHSNELDDGGATGGQEGDAIHIDKFLNGENVDGADLVVWYHAGHLHKNPLACVPVGPLIIPFGSW
ncbi:MAG: hypothetical protein ACRD2U_10410 [Terriglobales bacterium]